MKSRREPSRSHRPRRGAAVGRAADEAIEAEDDFALSPAQIRELQRRVKDLDDRTRYLLVSSFSPRFMLFYVIAEDTYAMNEPSAATLFKRRSAALAIKRLLGASTEIVECRVDRRGRLVKASLRLRPAHRRRAGAQRRTR